MTHLISLGAFGLVLLYTGLVSMLWWFQERVVFQPPGSIAPSNAPSDVPARRVSYHTSDGVQLFAYVVGDCAPSVQTAQSRRTVMLAFHGNADIARWLVPWASTVVHETGACVVLPEYRGYDGAGGSPTYAASSLDARAAFDFVRDTMHVSASDMVLYGHSLGTAIAAELASAETPRSLVLQSPFSTARDMAARMFVPGLTLFWKLISRVHFNTIGRVHALRAPVWVAHGDKDMIIPVRMGRAVFDAASQKGQLLIVHGAGHNDVAAVGGHEYWSWLVQAMRGAPLAGTPPTAAPGARAETR